LDDLRSRFTSTQSKQSERLDNLWLLSTEAFDAVEKGEIFLKFGPGLITLTQLEHRP
jgi:hypothetical protein